MENVLVAIVIIFLVLFAALTLTNAVFTSQDMLNMSRVDTEIRLQEQARTQLAFAEVKTHAGTQAVVTLRNTGSIKLADFDQWDVIVQYFDDATPAGYHINWLPYTATLNLSNQWTVGNIYADAALGAPEIYERGILDPNEEAVFDIRFSPPIGPGTYVQLVITTPNGSRASTIFRRNVPPVLATNTGILVNSGESVVIDARFLETTDIDDEAVDLVYTVTASPTQGLLTPDTTYTQADIENGLLLYTDMGALPDTFEFTVSDGEDYIGPYTFNITVNLPPTVEINTGIAVPAGMSGAIGDLLLKASDPDNASDELIFTVITPPVQGHLSMTSFSQSDIDNANVNYTNTNPSATSDSFEFSISDGHKQIGPFTFAITLT